MQDIKQNINLIKLFFKDKSLVRQHIESYNYFVDHEIKEIVQSNSIIDSDIDPDFYLKFIDVRVSKPTITENMIESDLYPIECRNRGLTYGATIYVDIEYVRNGRIVVQRNVEMGKLPIMLRSNRCVLNDESKPEDFYECSFDNGGYFVIRGVERLIQVQEQLCKNRILVEMSKTGLISTVVSSTIEHKSKTNVIYKNDVFFVQSNIFTEDVNLILLVRACGGLTDQEIVEIIGVDAFHLINNSFELCNINKIFNEEQALLYLSQYVNMKVDCNKIKEMRSLLSEKLLSNVSVDKSLRNKGIFLCLMARRLAFAKLGKIGHDSKDYLGNKRYDLAGQMISFLYEDTFKKFCFELKKQIDKILSKRTSKSDFDALTFFNLLTGSITYSLNRSIITGRWNLKRFRMDKSGVTHVITRYSYLSALGMMSKVNSQVEKITKVSGPRSLQTSTWGMICPSDTPEGEGCGLVKNLALLTEITTDSDSDVVMLFLEKNCVKKLEYCFAEELTHEGSALVFINGSIFGVADSPSLLCDLFRKARRKGIIDKYCSIFYNKIETSISISTDSGRMCRPLFIINREKLQRITELNEDQFIDNFDKKNFRKIYEILEKLDLLFDAQNLAGKDFNDLIIEGKIEYLDVNEQNDCKIAFTPEDIKSDTTHLEISELSILGNVASLVPFPDHNQSPRNTYQCAMGKQAIGHIGTNIRKRFDNLMLQLNCTQRPLASSVILDINKYNKIPSGLNAMVAVMSYSGYDIEDAIILNRGSLDRGFARVEVYRTIEITLRKFSTGLRELLQSPDGKKEPIVSIGQFIKCGDPLVYKISPMTNQISIIRHKGLPCYIDRILFTKSEEETIIKIVTRETRIPEIGDKFSSRHGQKGVVGLVVAPEDMPFSETGLVPDIIMNPHGFPSRMTVGKIMECIGAKGSLFTGKFTDATPFNYNEIDEFCETLVKYGFSSSGKDIFTSGTTGEQIEAYVFYGPIFYQRLKHMVADKIHSRSRGPRAILTRQPTEGRSNDGGLRLGEMERDCLIGYGATSLLIERLMLASDAYSIYVCNRCGIIGYSDGCTACNINDMSIVQIPYAAKLLFQELMSINILPKLTLKN